MVNNIKLLSKNILDSIPDEPRIPLHNYLLYLTNESDGKGKSLYLNNVESFIKEVWEDIVKDNRRKLSIRQLIPTKLDVGTGLFYAYKNGRKGISIQMLHKLLQLWGEYCNKSKENINKKWDEIFESEYTFSVSAYNVRTKLPRDINPKLSYLIGWIIGDGSIEFHKHGYIISIADKSRNQLEFVLKPLIKECFNIAVPIFVSMGNGFRIQFGSKPLFRFLKQVLRLKVGEIPKIIDGFDNINLKYFLLGLFDSEGYVSKSSRDPIITISQSSLEFQKNLIGYFGRLGIIFKGPYFHSTKLGDWYTIRVRKKEDILKFNEIINSNHIDKQLRLKNLVVGVEKNRCS